MDAESSGRSGVGICGVYLATDGSQVTKILNLKILIYYLFVAGFERALHRRRATPARQQRWMDVERAKPRGGEETLRQPLVVRKGRKQGSQGWEETEGFEWVWCVSDLRAGFDEREHD